MMALWGAVVADGINSCAAELADLRGQGKLKSLREPDRHKSHFHFRFISTTQTANGQTTTTYSIGEGAVQIGGYTYFTAGGTITGMGSGTKYVCAVVATASGAISFAAYSSTSALNTAQSDMSKYIFPLYKVVDYKVEIDYRPMPNSGGWEIAESVSNSGTSGSGGTGNSGTSGSGTSGEGGGE